MWSQSLAAGCLTVYQEGRVQPPQHAKTARAGDPGSTPVATATGRGPRRAILARWGGGVRTRREGRWSPKPVLAGSNPVTPAKVLEGRAWYSGWCLGPPTR